MDQGVGQELQTAQLDGGSDLSRPSALPLSTGNAAVRWLAAGTETQKLYAVPLARNLHRQACASGGPELARSQLLLCAKCEREARGRRGPRAHGRLRRRRYPRMLSVERERADLSPGTRKRKRGTVRPTPGRRERNVAIAVVRLGTARIVKALVREMRFCFEHALPTALRRPHKTARSQGRLGGQCRAPWGSACGSRTPRCHWSNARRAPQRSLDREPCGRRERSAAHLWMRERHGSSPPPIQYPVWDHAASAAQADR